MGGSRSLIVGFALLTATLIGVWTIQNHLFRREVAGLVSEVRDILDRTQLDAVPASTAERILELRAELESLNAGLQAQLGTRRGLIDQASTAETIESVHELLDEMRTVIEQSQALQGQAQRALRQLTDEYARRISEIERQSAGAPRDLLGRIGTVLALVGAISVMALGWRKDAREAAEARKKAAARA
jgi:DNA anti-recombination protein RmuC